MKFNMLTSYNTLIHIKILLSIPNVYLPCPTIYKSTKLWDYTLKSPSISLLQTFQKTERGIILINFFFYIVLEIPNLDLSSHSTIPVVIQSNPIIDKAAAQKLPVHLQWINKWLIVSSPSLHK